jgi:hypothetical protein
MGRRKSRNRSTVSSSSADARGIPRWPLSLFHQIFEMPSVQSNIHKKKKPLEKAYLLLTYGPMARSRVRLTRITMKRPVPLAFN